MLWSYLTCFWCKMCNGVQELRKCHAILYLQSYGKVIKKTNTFLWKNFLFDDFHSFFWYHPFSLPRSRKLQKSCSNQNLLFMFWFWLLSRANEINISYCYFKQHFNYCVVVFDSSCWLIYAAGYRYIDFAYRCKSIVLWSDTGSKYLVKANLGWIIRARI